MAVRSKLMSEKIAEKIARLEAEQREAEAREDADADALLLRLARKSHMRDSFLKQARDAIKQHERELARQRSSDTGGDQEAPTIGG